mmetsp:Transcript_19245/g.65443  ORF Transcript_19245/g.65443 Transcript_19245/m.65443 type:complete len:208 (-) Transcript_19245:166-789(-)
MATARFRMALSRSMARARGPSSAATRARTPRSNAASTPPARALASATSDACCIWVTTASAHCSGVASTSSGVAEPGSAAPASAVGAAGSAGALSRGEGAGTTLPLQSETLSSVRRRIAWSMLPHSLSVCAMTCPSICGNCCRKCAIASACVLGESAGPAFVRWRSGEAARRAFLQLSGEAPPKSRAATAPAFPASASRCASSSTAAA